VPHIAERMGAFVLIILGETIISIMIGHVEATPNGYLTAFLVTFGFYVICYCIGKLYFDSQPSEHEIHHHRAVHALSTSMWRARIWKWLNIILYFALLGLGLGSKITIHALHYEYDHEEPWFVFLPGMSCVVICICINCIRWTHPFDYEQEDLDQKLVIVVWIMRVLVVAVMFMVMFAYKTVHHGWILGIYVVCFIFQVVIDFEAKTRLRKEGKFEKAQSANYYKSPKARPSKKGGFHLSGHGHGHGHGHGGGHGGGHKGHGHGGGHGGGHGHHGPKGGHQGHYYRRKHHSKNGYHRTNSNADMDHEESRTIREISTTQLSFIGTF